MHVIAAVNPARADEFVAIVNAENEVTEISLQDLRRIYRGERKYWKNGDAIHVFLPPRGTPAMQYVIANVLEMRSVVELAQYYLEAIYQEKIPEPPATMTVDESLAVVANSKHAVAVVPRSRAVGRDDLKIIDLGGE